MPRPYDPANDSNGPTAEQLHPMEQEVLLAFAIGHFGALQRVVEHNWRQERMFKLAEDGFLTLHDTGARDQFGNGIIQVVAGPRLHEVAPTLGYAPQDLAVILSVH